MLSVTITTIVYMLMTMTGMANGLSRTFPRTDLTMHDLSQIMDKSGSFDDGASIYVPGTPNKEGQSILKAGQPGIKPQDKPPFSRLEKNVKYQRKHFDSKQKPVQENVPTSQQNSTIAQQMGYAVSQPQFISPEAETVDTHAQIDTSSVFWHHIVKRGLGRCIHRCLRRHKKLNFIKCKTLCH